VRGVPGVLAKEGTRPLRGHRDELSPPLARCRVTNRNRRPSGQVLVGLGAGTVLTGGGRLLFQQQPGSWLLTVVFFVDTTLLIIGTLARILSDYLDGDADRRATDSETRLNDKVTDALAAVNEGLGEALSEDGALRRWTTALDHVARLVPRRGGRAYVPREQHQSPHLGTQETDQSKTGEEVRRRDRQLR